MEKFSAFRDPGTGIQPFLTPVPPVGTDLVANLLLPFGYVLGAIRSTLILVLALLYMIVVRGISIILKPIPPLHLAVEHLFIAIFCRLALLLVGLWWIPVEVVTRKRGRTSKGGEKWNPRARDVIISNWVSWIEILWLAFRFNPIFVMPVFSPVNLTTSSSRTSTPVTHTPGRRTGTGSAAVSSPSSRTPTPQSNVLGFRTASLFSILSASGNVPGGYTDGEEHSSLKDIRTKADRPVVVFPECTTSNGRGLLRFANLFVGVDVPVKQFRVFVMCVRYDPPTNLSPTMSHSISSLTLNPLSHVFKLTTSIVPLTMSIRLLAPSESPSSGSFLASEFSSGNDVLSETSAGLIAQIGKMKRVGMGWEDKAAFLEFYRGKKQQ